MRANVNEALMALLLTMALAMPVSSAVAASSNSYAYTSSGNSPTFGYDLTRIVDDIFPSADEIWDDVKTMVDFGPRYPASDAHNALTDWLEQEMRAMGMVNIGRQEVVIEDRWTPHEWGLGIIEKDGTETPIRVANYFSYSGKTGPEGIVADMVYRPFGIPLNVKNKIVLCESIVPPLLMGMFLPLIWYMHEPSPRASTQAVVEDYRRSWMDSATFGHVSIPNLHTLKEAGAVGAVVIVDLPYSMADGEHLFYKSSYSGLPAVIVDRDTGSMLKQELLRNGGPVKAHLTMHASVERASMYHLYGFLPGKSDEIVLLQSHSDGENAIEENGVIGLINIAKYFSRIPQEFRRRTLGVVFNPGHTYGPLTADEARSFVEAHPDIIERTAGVICLEHLGCPNWLETSPGVYEDMGRPETASTFVTSDYPALVNKCIELVKENDLRRTAVLRGIPTVYEGRIGEMPMGTGGPFFLSGLPAVGYLAGPTYLMGMKTGDIDVIDKERMYKEVWTFAQLTGWLLNDGPGPFAALLGPSAIHRPWTKLFSSYLAPLSPVLRQLPTSPVAPVVQITSPVEDEVVWAINTIKVKGRASDPNSIKGVYDDIEIVYVLIENETWCSGWLPAQRYGSDLSSWKYEFDAIGLPDGNYRISAKAFDKAGLDSSADSTNITVNFGERGG